MQHSPARLLVGATALLALAAALAAPATAQIENAQLGGYGSRVKVGDFDYLPLTKRASAAVRVMEWDAGIPGDVRDNCILLLMDNTDGGPARAVIPLPGAQTVYTKDIRLTRCQGKDIGTAVVDTDIVEQTAAYVERAAELRYGDLNGNGKYDRGDPVYLGTMTGTTRGLAPSTATGAWTIRVAPATGFSAGTYVFSSDADFVSYRTIATGPAIVAGTSPAARTWSLAEREGNGWYFIPAGAGYAANMAIPVNAVRIGIVGVLSQQAAVVPSSVQLPDEAPQAGEDYKVVIRFGNDGNGAGAGLLVTKLDGQIVDARMTPALAPSERSSTLVAIPMPEEGGVAELDIAGYKVTVAIEGGSAPAPSASADQLAALQARIDALEARLQHATAPSIQPASVEVETAKAPASPLVVFAGVILALALALRRRA